VAGAVDEYVQELEGFVSEGDPDLIAPEGPAGGVQSKRREILHNLGAIVPRIPRQARDFRPTVPTILPKSYRGDAELTVPTALLPESNPDRRAVSERINFARPALSPRRSTAGPRSLSSLPA
jgi:hypothetical protein